MQFLSDLEASNDNISVNAKLISLLPLQTRQDFQYFSHEIRKKEFKDILVSVTFKKKNFNILLIR